MGQNGVRVPRGATLDGFRELIQANKGISVKDLPLGAILKIRTINSVYTLMMTDGGVLMKGGHRLPELTLCTYRGATFGGANIKLGWVVLGMCMEIEIPEGIMTTSSVQSIGVVTSPGSAVH